MRQPRHGARPPDTPRGLPLPLLLALQAVLRCRRCCAGTERSVGRVRLSRAQRPLRKCMVITGRTDGRTPDNLRVATSAKNFLSKFCAPGTDNFRVATSATHFFEIRATGTGLPPPTSEEAKKLPLRGPSRKLKSFLSGDKIQRPCGPPTRRGSNCAVCSVIALPPNRQRQKTQRFAP